MTARTKTLMRQMTFAWHASKALCSKVDFVKARGSLSACYMFKSHDHQMIRHQIISAPSMAATSLDKTLHDAAHSASINSSPQTYASSIGLTSSSCVVVKEVELTVKMAQGGGVVAKHNINVEYNHFASRLMLNIGILSLSSALLRSSTSISKPILLALTRCLTTSISNSTRIIPDMSIREEQEKLLTDSRANKQVKINFGGKLYERLAKESPELYSYAPKESGIDFTVQYYDSYELIKPTKSEKKSANYIPTVCMLHGAPGHYSNFANLINYLTSRGVRVIAPNFPEYEITYDQSFRHSPKERAEFLLQFFKALKVNKFDMLIGHSGATFTIMELLTSVLEKRENFSQLAIKSISLFSAPTYKLPPNAAATPSRVFTLKLYDYAIFRPIITSLIHVFVKLQGITTRIDPNRIGDFLIAASVVSYTDLNELERQTELIVESKLPTYLVVGTNDKLIAMEYFEYLKQAFGIKSDKQVKFYNQDGSVKQDAIEPNDSVHVSQIEGGGHYAFQKYANQVNEEVYNFLVKQINQGK